MKTSMLMKKIGKMMIGKMMTTSGRAPRHANTTQESVHRSSFVKRTLNATGTSFRRKDANGQEETSNQEEGKGKARAEEEEVTSGNGEGF